VRSPTIGVFEPGSDSARVYRALVSHPGTSPAQLAELAGLSEPRVRRALAELGRVDMVSRSGEDWDAQRPDVVATTVLRGFDAWRSKVRETEEELMNLFRFARTRDSRSLNVEVLDSPVETFAVYEQLQDAVQDQVRGIDRPPYYWDEAELARQEKRQLEQMTAGIAYRTIYQESKRDSPLRSASMMRTIAGGEKARILREPPVKLTITDDQAAILALDPPPGAEGSLVVLLVHPSGFLDTLIRIFESLWRLAVPADVVDGDQELSAGDREILSLMASGATDDAISRRLGMSRRTVVRRAARLLERLGASTRFQAGVQAAHRGWL
jgi:DNA-binding CsgD family transcriptional regulator/DNA-binding MarR family transcriptional regulator